MTFKEKRAHYRMKINVPVFIQGTDSEGNRFYDLSHTFNVSACGAGLACQHPINLNEQLIVSIPAPLNIETDQAMEEGSKFKALVTRVEEPTSTHDTTKIYVRFDRPLYE